MRYYPQHDNILEYCNQLCQACISKGIFLKPQISVIDTDLIIDREEYALASNCIHRGFYCPSPVREYIVTNERRGRIAKRVTKSTRPTNRYLFDKENRLRIAETFYPNGSTKTEYIFYETPYIYGFYFNPDGVITELSVEQYANGEITEYLWAHLWYDSSTDKYLPRWIIFETYAYGNNEIETAFYNITYTTFPVPHQFVNSAHYRFELSKNGAVLHRKK